MAKIRRYRIGDLQFGDLVDVPGEVDSFFFTSSSYKGVCRARRQPRNSDAREVEETYTFEGTGSLVPPITG